jgi:hypothetical protein
VSFQFIPTNRQEAFLPARQVHPSRLKKRLAKMLQAHSEQVARVQWFKADEQTLGGLRPGAPFNARASFQAFGERQFGSEFIGVACCCELPADLPPRWEAALELHEQKTKSELH